MCAWTLITALPLTLKRHSQPLFREIGQVLNIVAPPQTTIAPEMMIGIVPQNPDSQFASPHGPILPSAGKKYQTTLEHQTPKTLNIPPSGVGRFESTGYRSN